MESRVELSSRTGTRHIFIDRNMIEKLINISAVCGVLFGRSPRQTCEIRLVTPTGLHVVLGIWKTWGGIHVASHGTEMNLYRSERARLSRSRAETTTSSSEVSTSLNRLDKKLTSVLDKEIGRSYVFF